MLLEKNLRRLYLPAAGITSPGAVSKGTIKKFLSKQGQKEEELMLLSRADFHRDALSRSRVTLV